MENNWKDFYTKGFFSTNDPLVFLHLENLLLWTRWIKIPWDKTEKVPINKIFFRRGMEKTSKKLIDKYIIGYNKNVSIKSKDIWSGADRDSFKWHNDLIEGSNLTVLLYYSTVKENTGGELMVRKAETKEITGVHLPVKYDIIFLNQSSDWEHRVSDFVDPRMERIVINFGYKI
ncbi:MAG: 2OG-Fe(II) oxygenase [bacterium]|nr:2OG-Fe(II) oxygenase [bacterium]